MNENFLIGLNSKIEPYFRFYFDPVNYSDLLQGDNWLTWSHIGEYLAIFYTLSGENRLLLFDKKSGKNILEQIGGGQNYLILPSGMYPIFVGSNSLLGYDLFMASYSSETTFYKFILVSNSFNIFSLLGWIGTLVNDVLTLIGSNSGYSMGIEQINNINYSFEITYQTYSITNVANLFMSYNIVPVIMPSNTIDQCQYLLNSNTGEVMAYYKGTVHHTGTFNKCTYFYDWQTKTNYCTDGVNMFSISDNRKLLKNIKISTDVTFQGMIAGNFVINSSLYDTDFNYIKNLPEELSNLSANLFFNSDLGYAYIENKSINRLYYDGSNWTIGETLPIPNEIIDNYNSGQSSTSFELLDDGTVLLNTTGYDTNHIISYRISPAILIDLSFPEFVSGKICGC